MVSSRATVRCVQTWLGPIRSRKSRGVGSSFATNASVAENPKRFGRIVLAVERARGLAQGARRGYHNVRYAMLDR
jgi:hypothetical protein